MGLRNHFQTHLCWVPGSHSGEKTLRRLFSNTGSSGLGASLREWTSWPKRNLISQCIYQNAATGNQCLIGEVIILPNAHSSALISVQTSCWQILAAVEVGKVSPPSRGWAAPCCRLLHSSSGHPPWTSASAAWLYSPSSHLRAKASLHSGGSSSSWCLKPRQMSLLAEGQSSHLGALMP